MDNIKRRYRNLIRFTMFAVIAVFVIGSAGQLTLSAQQGNDFVTVYPAEDTSYFTNPGIGWQRMEYNNPPLLSESVVYPTREDISWRTLNPNNGQYNWSILDNKIEAAANNGQLFSFRVYTMQGESYGGHHVPQWVIDRDSRVIQGGSPDYANCSYQTYWASFVNQLRQRYDGDSRIAFIDISGYGNFNEWSWTDGQTVWEDDYMNPESLDGMARNRLADMFIGGSNDAHECESTNGNSITTSYNYPGFQSTQLVMPYAGIQQSTRYVAAQRSDAGIRYDCLGREETTNTDPMVKIGDVIRDTWQNAPIVFEFCANSTTEYDVMQRAEALINNAHAVIVHENLENPRDEMPLRRLMANVGYRYQLTQAVYDSSVAAGEFLSLSMAWQNVGTSPAYPSMGYDFDLHIYLLDADGNMITQQQSETNIAWWMPADPLPGEAPVNAVGEMLRVPSGLESGVYELRVAIVNVNSNQNINLAIEGADENGRYLIGEVTVEGEEIPTAQPTATITATPFESETPDDTSSTVTPMPANTELPTSTPMPTHTLTPTIVPDEDATLVPTSTDLPTQIPPTATAFPTEIPATATAIPTQIPPTATAFPTQIPASPTAMPPDSDAMTVHVSNLDGQRWHEGSGTWAVYIDITVRNSDNHEISGVTVSGIWHDGTSFSCVTSGGWCGARLNGIPRSQNTATFTITNLSHPTMAYNPAANSDPQEGRNNNRASNGTVITVTRRH